MVLHTASNIEDKSGKMLPIPQPENALPHLPAYTSISPSNAVVAEIVDTWEQKPFAKGWPETAKRYNLVLQFTPEIRQHVFRRLFRNREKHPAWHATLLINAKNIPRLMQEGLHWSAANVVKGEDELVFDDPGSPIFLGCYQQRYKLKNTPGKAEWMGDLRVYGRSSEHTYNFDLSQITVDTVIKVKAYSCEGRLVYYAHKLTRRCYNLIFNSMPLDGWWPAPKTRGNQIRGWE